MSDKSDAEELMAFHIRALSLPEPVREHVFAPPRKWRFDFAWPDRMVALEVEGGIWTGGRHTTGAGFEADCQKYNRAVIDGWRVLRVTPGMIVNGEAMEAIEQVLT